MDAEQKFKYMTEEPIPRLVCSLAVPTIISMLITSFYNMVDTFFVGRINTSATAAVGVVFSLMAIIQAFGFFFGHGSGNYISRQLGAQNMDEASKMASIGFFSALFTGMVLAVLGLIFIEPLARLLGSTETILPYAVDYLKYILVGAPYMTASLVLNNQLRFQGNAMYGMVGIVAGAVINIALDPILIFMCGMGIGGAALATIISQFISFMLLLWVSQRGPGIHISWKNARFSGYFLKEMVRGGVPSLCRQGLGSVATIALNVAAGVYGDAAIAGMSIVSRITMFAYSALIGFGQGFQPVCGFNYGAKLYDRVREAFYFCLKTAAGFLILLSVAGYIGAPQLIELFRKGDPEVTAVGIAALRFSCISFTLSGGIVMSNMLLQSIGMAVRASIVAAARQGLFFLPLIFILPTFLGLRGVEMCQMVSDILTFLLAMPLSISVLNKMGVKKD
ncbi:MATE family efflux transporter [Frisingicoccus sp.]|uniref:MATE family efflux transporter n=1 Tax=Frisingicoccus sp. TaxID=1918627 RepID=UPI003AB2C940